MTNIGFDALTRRAAALVSRRKSILALSGLALGAAANPSFVEAKGGKGKKKKCGKKCDERCQAQKQQCLTRVEVRCATEADPADCRADCNPCCDSLATCDANSSTTCLLDCVDIP